VGRRDRAGAIERQAFEEALAALLLVGQHEGLVVGGEEAVEHRPGPGRGLDVEPSAAPPLELETGVGKTGQGGQRHGWARRRGTATGYPGRARNAACRAGAGAAVPDPGARSYPAQLRVPPPVSPCRDRSMPPRACWPCWR